MTKFKHNKKRDTAIVYNILVTEFIEGSAENRSTADESLKLIKEFFGNNSVLKRELHLYNDLLSAYSNSDFDNVQLVEKLIEGVRKERDRLDIDKINETKSKLIGRINRTLGKDVWNKHTVTNYKNIATVYQILESPSGQSDRVLLEKKYIDDVVSNKDVQPVVLMEDVDLVFKMAKKEFKAVYSDKLLEEQNETLLKYINSYKDNGLEYKLHISDEIDTIKETLKGYLYNEKVLEDEELRTLVKEALDKFESFKKCDDDELILETVLRSQQLIREIK